MTDDNNNDLTEFERPVLSDSVRVLHGSLATDDSGFTRITDPTTGAGLFTSNTDPNVVGVDPLTGTTAPTGTDTGFGGYLRRAVISLVENGDFSVPPKDINAAISASNPLPGWRWEQSSGSAIEAYWEADSSASSGGRVRFDCAAGAAGDRAYLEQLVKVVGNATQRWAVAVNATWETAGFATDHEAHFTGQALTGALATTGSASTSDTPLDILDAAGSVTAQLGHSESLPADAYYYRVRVGLERASAATTETASVYLNEAAARLFGDLLVLVDQSTPANAPASLLKTGGNLSILNGSGQVTIDDAGPVGINDSTPTGQLEVASGTATRAVSVLRGAASQSANYLTVQTSGGTAVAQVDGNGFALIGNISVNSSGAKLQTVDGVTFPATQVASSDANTLDDYEEGTWTPVLTAATAGDLSVVYDRQFGRYQKVGNLVHWHLFLRTTTWTHTTASGAVQVTGLPFTAATVANFLWPGSASVNFTKAGYSVITPTIASAAALITWRAAGNGVAIAQFNIADLPTGTQVNLMASGSYEAA